MHWIPHETALFSSLLKGHKRRPSYYSIFCAVPLASWTLETDEHGYAKATEIRVTKAGQHVIQFVTTLWNDTRLEVSSDSFEVVPGPATAAVFSLNPPSRVLLREPFSVVAFLVDSYGNETTTPPELQRKGNPVEAHLSAFNKAGRKVSLHGHTTQVWGGGKISFEGLWFSEPDHITLKASLCNGVSHEVAQKALDILWIVQDF